MNPARVAAFGLLSWELGAAIVALVVVDVALIGEISWWVGDAAYSPWIWQPQWNLYVRLPWLQVLTVPVLVLARSALRLPLELARQALGGEEAGPRAKSMTSGGSHITGYRPSRPTEREGSWIPAVGRGVWAPRW